MKLVLIGTGILVAGAVFAVFSRLRYATLARWRRSAGVSFETFRRSDVAAGVPDELLRTVYDHFAELAAPPIPVLASDRLDETFGIVGDDVPEELQGLADKCRRARPTDAQAHRVETVADAVALLHTLGPRSGEIPNARPGGEASSIRTREPRAPRTSE